MPIKMMHDQKIKIEVAYATPDSQVIIPLEVAQGCTIDAAIKQSDILKQFPEIDLKSIDVGIFSKRANLDTVLENDERVEIYRPLIIDPKETRRKRAAKA